MKSTIHLLPIRITLALIITATTLSAANWGHWRGPQFDGSSDEKGLPTKFSKTENVKWVVDMPGPAAATPIIWDDHVFISSTDSRAQVLLAMAYDRKTGKQLWKKEVGQGIRKDRRSNYASPSPVTDGKHVYFFYGTGELVAFDFKGNKAWSRNLQKDYGDFAFLWTFSTSPTLAGGHLYMQILQRDSPVSGRGQPNAPSYLLALNPENGKENFRIMRPSKARQESLEAFTTPVPSGDQLLVVGGDCITGHDIKTGRELWRWGTWNPTRITHWRHVPSPVVGGGIALACAPKQNPVYAVKLGGKGTLADSDVAWKSPQREISSDVSTPLFYKDHFYVLNGDKDFFAKVNPASGNVVWSGDLNGGAKIESSPTGADGKIYFINFRGDVFVADAGDQYKILHKTNMGDPGDNEIRSSISVSQGNLFIRTAKKLYCIGN